MHRDRRSTLWPVLATLLAIGLFSLMDALMKRASLVAGVYPALLCRSLLAVALIAPAWRLRGGKWPPRPIMRLHLLRGLVVTGMAASFFWGLVRVPMAEGIAVSFVSPLIALALAAAALREPVGRTAILGALLGFAGVATIAAGRFAEGGATPEKGWGMAAIVVSAGFYAWNLILQRQQALVSQPLEVAVFQNGVIALAMLPFAPLWWAPPGLGAAADVAGAALLVSISLMLLTWAYARAQTQVLVPLEYSAFVWAAVMGWAWFDEVLTASTLAGMALIVGGCVLGSRPIPRADRHAAP